MTNLSPAAQAVLDAAYREMDYAPRRHVQCVTAAALRAAVAHTQQYQGKDCLSDEVWTCDADVLLAIATELEGNIE
jgi:hypothetical protein